MNWLVYIIRCDDGTLYTGITNDLARRWQQHRSQRGAKYFRGRQPEALVYAETGHDRSSASRREAAIKRLERGGKLKLLESELNRASAMAEGLDDGVGRRGGLKV